MKVAPGRGSSRRRGQGAAQFLGHAPGASLRFAFTAAAALALLLNEAVMALWPLWPAQGREEKAEGSNQTDAAVLAGDAPGVAWKVPMGPKPAILAPRFHGCAGSTESGGVAVMEPEAASTWQDLENPLFRLQASSLRLLPAPGPKGDSVAQGQRRWLTFGLSSIKRPKASYLGITLSRMLNVMDLEDAPTAVVVHLADFNEAWVQQTAQWLYDGFRNFIEEGRLQAIHAPQSLYPLKQIPLAAVSLAGFASKGLNSRYIRRDGDIVFDHVTYWTESGEYFLFWCQSLGSAVAHRRWGIASSSDFEEVKQGNCRAYARAPEDHDVLDPRVTGWEEWIGNRWQKVEDGGVSNLELQEGELLKFGDSPQRQWWRTKQNLDYTFLMWYASNMSEYYMQLEDDIQPVPHFAAAVRSYIDRSLLAEQWVMASFSSLGFIGKFFNTSHLPKLAQFLLTFSTEAPCDWLVWDWIDALTTEPVTGDIPKDVENEIFKREEAQKEGKEALEKLGFMRDDLQLYYMTKGIPQIFGSAPESKQASQKPPIEANGVWNLKSPRAEVTSTLEAYKSYTADQAYPPGDLEGFWTSDTCAQKDTWACEAGGKYFRLVFHEAVDLARVEIRQARKGHEEDYIRRGRLQVAYDKSCRGAVTLLEMSKPREVWEGKLAAKVMCLNIQLSKPQQEWISIQEIIVEPVLPSATQAKEEKSEQGASSGGSDAAKGQRSEAPDAGSAPHQALLHALVAAFSGLVAGAVGWLAIWEGRRRCEEGLELVGGFACWVASFVAVLDAALLCVLAPPPFPLALEDAENAEATPTAPRRLASLPEEEAVADDRLPRKLCSDGKVRQQRLQIDWRSMRPGIRQVDISHLQDLGPGSDPRSPSASSSDRPQRKFISVGVVVDPSSNAPSTAEAMMKLVRAGAGDAVVAVLVAQTSRGSADKRAARSDFVDELRRRLSALEPESRAMLHLLDPSPGLYPPAPHRSDNVDIALLAMFLAPLAENFMQVEASTSLFQGYVRHIQDYTLKLDAKDIPWILVLFTKLSRYRKLLRSRLLHRWAEMLVMFPDTPADDLFWDFIDVVGNETAPKAIYLGTDAAKRSRPDVKLQHHGHSALIDHLGDVSSLSGKVQRAQENYFKKHELIDTLFDNPPGQLFTNLEGRHDMLQSLYDERTPDADVTCGGHSARSCKECPQGHGAGWCNVECMWAQGACTAVFKSDDATSLRRGGKEAFIELVFDEPQDVEIVNLRMGGQVMPPPKCKKDCTKAEIPDGDFDHTLDDAMMLFGRGEASSAESQERSRCNTYDTVQSVAGREVFWRAPQSDPAVGVRCIRIAIQRAQQRPLIFRHLQVRTPKAKKGKATTTAAEVKSLRPPLPAEAPLLRGGLPQHPALQPPQPQVDVWREKHLEWVLLVSVAFVSGAFAGVLGCVFDSTSKTGKRRRKV